MGQLHLDVQCLQQYFELDHRIHHRQYQDIEHNLDDNYSGVGLENLKNNLNLVYPNQHRFTIEDTKDSFTVVIEIEDEQ